MSASSLQMPPAYFRTARRWKLGHQVFHLQLVAMNTVLAETTDHLHARRFPEVAEGLHSLCDLFDAATATMAYTSDFPAEHYSNFIRPSMAPPFASPGFSGLLNREHMVMLKTLKQLWAVAVEVLGNRREQWPSTAIQAFEELKGAVHRNRESHGLICEHFVPGGASLLKAL